MVRVACTCCGKKSVIVASRLYRVYEAIMTHAISERWVQCGDENTLVRGASLNMLVYDRRQRGYPKTCSSPTTSSPINIDCYELRTFNISAKCHSVLWIYPRSCALKCPASKV